MQLKNMTEDQKRAYVLADNKLAPNAGWDDDLLAVELGILMSSYLDFDVGITGFSIPEINSLIETVEPEEPCDPADDVVQENDPARVPLGNVWQLGPHRLVCGDALEAETVNTLMDGSSAQMITTDPSYNVPIDGHVDNSGKNPHREFVMASGEMTPKGKIKITAFEGVGFSKPIDWTSLPPDLVHGSTSLIRLDLVPE